jgi:small conductance mechanosensitive channel
VIRLLATTTDDGPCGPDGTSVCDWVFEHTDDNETAAKVADWLVGRPFQILVILVIAWFAKTIARWMIHRGVRRLMVPPSAVTKSISAVRGGHTDTVADEIEIARRKARAESLGAVVAGVVGVVIWIIAIFAIAGVLGVDLAPLIAGAGVAGVALGFGAQSLVRDCIAGLFMLLEDQYGIGDVVDLGAASGTVEHVSLRTTVLRGLDGTVWHVPNGEVRRVGNQSQLWSVAVVDVEVASDADLGAAREYILRAAVEVCERPQWKSDVLEAPRVLGVESVGAQVVTIRLNVKTRPGRQWALQRALREGIKQVLDQEGIAHTAPRAGA